MCCGDGPPTEGLGISKHDRHQARCLHGGELLAWRLRFALTFHLHHF